MKIKDQARKLAGWCSKHCFEVVDETDEVSNYIQQGEADVVWRDFLKVLTPTDKPEDSKNYPTQ